MYTINGHEDVRSVGGWTEIRQTGLAHLSAGLDSEDVILTREGRNVHVFGLADGQSGKRCCTLGAEAALAAVADYIEEKTITRLRGYTHLDEIQYELIRAVRARIDCLAAAKKEASEEFASTLVVFALDTQTKEYLTVHLGDGGIIGRRTDTTLHMISVPENGITSRYTWLTTSPGALMHMRVGFGEARNYDRIFLFSDGAQAICRGANISAAARWLMTQEDTRSLEAYLQQSRPEDDASCLAVDLRAFDR